MILIRIAALAARADPNPTFSDGTKDSFSRRSQGTVILPPDFPVSNSR
jgi:hypothetical protein